MTLFGVISLLSVFKFLLITTLVVYAIFALLMMKQIASMTKAVTMKDDYVIRGLGILNFVFAIVVLIIALVIL